MVSKKHTLDIDPLETQDWIDSLNSLINEKGTNSGGGGANYLTRISILRIILKYLWSI